VVVAQDASRSTRLRVPELGRTARDDDQAAVDEGGQRRLDIPAPLLRRFHPHRLPAPPRQRRISAHVHQPTQPSLFLPHAPTVTPAGPPRPAFRQTSVTSGRDRAARGTVGGVDCIGKDMGAYWDTRGCGCGNCQQDDYGAVDADAEPGAVTPVELLPLRDCTCIAPWL
jgi:hypothetical protein